MPFSMAAWLVVRSSFRPWGRAGCRDRRDRGLDQVAGAGPGRQPPVLVVAERLDSELQVVVVVSGLNLGAEKLLRAAEAL